MLALFPVRMRSSSDFCAYLIPLNSSRKGSWLEGSVRSMSFGALVAYEGLICMLLLVLPPMVAWFASAWS